MNNAVVEVEAEKTKLEAIEAALLKNIFGGTWSDSSCDHGNGSCYTCESCTGNGA